MDVYKKELTKPIEIAYEKNDDTLAAIYGKPGVKGSTNVFSILDDATKNRTAEKNTVEENMDVFQTGLKKFEKDKQAGGKLHIPRKLKNCFVVDHYAASVNYDIKVILARINREWSQHSVCACLCTLCIDACYGLVGAVVQLGCLPCQYQTCAAETEHTTFTHESLHATLNPLLVILS